MGLLTLNDVAIMRDVIEEMLPDVCNILSESLASDGQGGATSTYGTIAARVPCRLDASNLQSNTLAVVAGAQREKHAYQLSVPYDTDISVGNHVEIGSEVYNVLSVNAGASWMAVGRATLEII